MDKDVRNRIQRATVAARALLEGECAAQLEGSFNIRTDGTLGEKPAAQLGEAGRVTHQKILAAIAHHRASGLSPSDAVGRFVRDAAFTTLNRFVALKMLEARGLVQECLSRHDQSSGFKEFAGLAPGLVQVPDRGYRMYLESLFDEVGREVRVLFDRRDPAALLWPRRQALTDLLEILNAPELSEVWGQDETIGWVYQYFNGEDERRRMRDESAAPRNSRELAVRNQFFTPRYVVQFLVDNTLGRLWCEMMRARSGLRDLEYRVSLPDGEQFRPKKDPRDLRILDPACGSGHFLLYAFDLLLKVYEEAWVDPDLGPPLWKEAGLPPAPATDPAKPESLAVLRRHVPRWIVRHNLHGIDIDPRAAQIAALAIWLRAQRAWADAGVGRTERPRIDRTNIVVAEPMPGDMALVEAFAATLDPPLLGDLFRQVVREMRLAGEMGSLLPVERTLSGAIRQARDAYLARQRRGAAFLPGLEPPRRQGELDLSGIDDERFFEDAENRILDALRAFAESSSGALGIRRRMFAGDAAQGMAFIETLRKRYDVVLMNPPFGAGSMVAKAMFEREYPRTRNDVYAAFVERGVQLLHPGGTLGAITSRTGFFLSSFQKWREEVILKEATQVVFADLGYGVMDDALVEAARYGLQ